MPYTPKKSNCSLVPDAATPSQNSPTGAALDRLSTALDRLEIATGDLMERLSPVLSEDVPSEKSCAASAQDDESIPLCRAINGATFKVEDRLLVKVTGMISRLGV
jgi:hypothetical protein